MNCIGHLIRFVVLGSMTLLLLCGDPPSENAVKKTDATIFIASTPPVAEVYMDEDLIGQTNIAELTVKSGQHKITLKKDSLQFDTIMTFKSGRNPSVLMKFD